MSNPAYVVRRADGRFLSAPPPGKKRRGYSTDPDCAERYPTWELATVIAAKLGGTMFVEAAPPWKEPICH